MAADSVELKDKINKAIETVEFSDEGYYISVGSGDVGGSENKIVHWYEALKKEYNSSSKDNMWVCHGYQWKYGWNTWGRV